MYKINYLLIPVILVLLPLTAWGAGEATATFLQRGVGSRAGALGEAYVSVSDDPSAAFYNPAGLKQIEKKNVYFMHIFGLLDSTQDYVSLVFPTKIGTLGVSGFFSTSGKIPKYENFVQTGDYSVDDYYVNLSYANSDKNESAYYGVNIKYFQSKIDIYKANGFAFDLGFLYRFQIINGLRIGFSVQNMGKKITYVAEADPLPLNFKVGTSYQLKKILISFDVNQPKYGELKYNVGGEFNLMDKFSIRGGYNSLNVVSGGFGLLLKNFTIDYAYVLHRNIDSTHEISMNISF